MTQTQTVDILGSMREGYKIMAEANSGGIRPAKLGWKWNIDGTTYFMLGEKQVHQLGETAIGKDAVGIVEVVKRTGEDVSTEVYAMDPEGELHVVGLDTLTKEASQDIRALAASLDGAEPTPVTVQQRAQFWGAVTWPLA
jgi:hypothetical protein